MSKKRDKKKPSRQKIRLSERDRAILRHVGRHRLTTVDMLHRQFFAGKAADAVKSTLRRLCGTAPGYLFLAPEQLDDQRAYYRLTRRGARLINAPKEATRPLGPQAKIERYATLWFIAAARPASRALLDPRQFPDVFDIGPHRLPRKNFYIDETAGGEIRLGYILVDHGAHPRRILRKACETTLRFLRQGWFDEYIRTRSFELSLLTFNAGRLKTLKLALEPHLNEMLRFPLTKLGLAPATQTGETPLPVNALIVPGLEPLVAGHKPANAKE